MVDLGQEEAGRLLLSGLRKVHSRIRSLVMEGIRERGKGAAEIVAETQGDTIFAIDRVGEGHLCSLLEEAFPSKISFLLICEGMESEEGIPIPRGISPEDARFRVIMDPVDGTRELMYGKRSAWILSGVALNRREETTLRDIFFAIQTEIPTAKQYISDTLWAFQGKGARGRSENLLNGKEEVLKISPSTEEDLYQGFAMVSRFFPGGRELLAKVDEELIRRVLGSVPEGRALVFEDQYISTGGQLYELMVGHDRFNADLRPLLGKVLGKEGRPLPPDLPSIRYLYSPHRRGGRGGALRSPGKSSQQSPQPDRSRKLGRICEQGTPAQIGGPSPGNSTGVRSFGRVDSFPGRS